MSDIAMHADFANLPSSTQEEILMYLNSGNFKAAVSCRERYLKQKNSLSPQAQQSPLSHASNDKRKEQSEHLS